MEILAKNLRDLRHQYGYTQTQIATEIGVCYQAYQKYELGTAIPPLPKLIKLADLFDVSLDFLVGRKEI